MTLRPDPGGAIDDFFGLPVPSPSSLTAPALVPSAPTVSATPQPGQGITTDLSGKLSPSVITLSPRKLSATSNLTITSAAQDVPGCSVTLVVPGIYLVVAVFDFEGTATGWSALAGQILVGGVADASDAILGDPGTAGCRGTVSQTALPTIAATALNPVIVKLQAFKTVNAGIALAHQTHTTLSIARVG